MVPTTEELHALETQLHVISTHLVGGQHEVRVYADTSPGDGFSPVESDLEGTFISLNLSQQAKRQAN